MCFHPGFRSYQDIRAEAEEFLGEYGGADQIPVPIEEIVEFDFGMDIIPVDGLSEQLRVDAFLKNDLSAIYVDQYVLQFVEVRYRFSLAHELGHYWLHDELYQANLIEKVADFEVVQQKLGDNYKWFEFQANSFAGLVLVPPDSLKARFTARLHAAKEGGIDPSSVATFPLRQRFIKGLAGDFNVSEQTMEIRIEKDGLLPPLTEV